MQYLRVVLTYVLTIYLVVLIGRMIFSWVQVFARDWRPSGILLVIAEGIFTITDPPLKLLRRFSHLILPQQGTSQHQMGFRETGGKVGCGFMTFAPTPSTELSTGSVDKIPC